MWEPPPQNLRTPPPPIPRIPMPRPSIRYMDTGLDGSEPTQADSPVPGSSLPGGQSTSLVSQVLYGGSGLTHRECHEIRFLDSFLAFTILSFLTGLIILIPFLTNYLYYPHFLTNFTPRKGTKNSQVWDYARSARSNKSTVWSTSTEDPESSGSY